MTMAPKKKGTTVNLRDLQREAGIGASILPTAPKTQEEIDRDRAKEDDKDKKKSRWADRVDESDADEWRRDVPARGGRDQKREEDSDEPWKHDAPNGDEVDFENIRRTGSNQATGSKQEEAFDEPWRQEGPPRDEADFGDIRRTDSLQGNRQTNGSNENRFQNRGNPNEGKKRDDKDDVDFSDVRASERSANAKNIKADEDIDFSDVRRGSSNPRKNDDVEFVRLPSTAEKSQRPAHLERLRLKAMEKRAQQAAAEAKSGASNTDGKSEEKTEVSNSEEKTEVSKSEGKKENEEKQETSKTEKKKETTENEEKKGSLENEGKREASKNEEKKEDVYIPPSKRTPVEMQAPIQASSTGSMPSSGSPSASSSETSPVTAEPEISRQISKASGGKFIPSWKRKSEETKKLQEDTLSVERGTEEKTDPSKETSSTKEEIKILQPVRLGKKPISSSGRVYVPPSRAGQAEKGSPSAFERLMKRSDDDDDKKREMEQKMEMERQKKKEEEKMRMEMERKKFQFDQERLENFTKCVEASVEKNIDPTTPSKSNALNYQDICKDMEDNDLSSIAPIVVVTAILFKLFSKCDSLDHLNQNMKHVKPLYDYLFDKCQIESKNQVFLRESVKIVHALRCPRICAETALVEAFWDALLMNQIVQEQEFLAWYHDDNDSTEGRNVVMFQVLPWFKWLNRDIDTDEGEEEVVECEEPDEDIEANVPKGFPNEKKSTRKR